MVILMFASTGETEETKIHRCLLADGTVAFQDTPCPDVTAETNEEGKKQRAPVAGEDISAFVNPFDEPAIPPADSVSALPEPTSQDRATCEKSARDAIDAIDLEMQENTYTREYLAELLVLTQQLRACKQL